LPLSTEVELFEEHAENAGFLWQLRDAATRDPAHDSASLRALDERVEAHVDGLRLAGDRGFAVCTAALDEAEGGEVFVAALLAVERADLRSLARILDRFGESPALAREIIAALGWASFEHVSRILPGLLDARCPPALHYLGIAAYAAHRRDPGPLLGYAIVSSDARLKARALRAAGELGRLDLLPELRAELGSADASTRFWAAWSAAIFGEPEAGRVLWEITHQAGPYAARACATAMRRMEPAVAYTWLHALGGGATMRAALAGATALGDPAVMPWILECMRQPEAARAAGAAFASLVGVDLVAERLHDKPPKGAPRGPSDDAGDDDVAMDPEESLAFPEPARVAAYWGTKSRDFKRGTRYLLGRPMSVEWLERVLESGSQPARAAAAEELSIRQPRRPLHEVRAPAFRRGRGE
jgi:uncharacterized protein (TIGR02270 family)